MRAMPTRTWRLSLRLLLSYRLTQLFAPEHLGFHKRLAVAVWKLIAAWREVKGLVGCLSHASLLTSPPYRRQVRHFGWFTQARCCSLRGWCCIAVAGFKDIRFSRVPGASLRKVIVFFFRKIIVQSVCFYFLLLPDPQPCLSLRSTLVRFSTPVETPLWRWTCTPRKVMCHKDLCCYLGILYQHLRLLS